MGNDSVDNVKKKTGKRRRGGLRGAALRERKRMDKEGGGGVVGERGASLRAENSKKTGGGMMKEEMASFKGKSSKAGRSKSLRRVLDVGSYVNVFEGMSDVVNATVIDPAPKEGQGKEDKGGEAGVIRTDVLSYARTWAEARDPPFDAVVVSMAVNSEGDAESRLTEIEKAPLNSDSHDSHTACAARLWGLCGNLNVARVASVNPRGGDQDL